MAHMETLEISEKNYLESEPALGRTRRTRTCTQSRLQVWLCVIVVILLIAAMGILMAMFGPGNKDLKYRDCCDCKGEKNKETAKSTDVQCDVAIIGGGISGLYVAETLLRTKKETSVCVFEKENRFGGRILDHLFPHAPDIAVGLGAWRIDENNVNMINLIRRLNISTVNWSFHKTTLHETRGVFANDSKEIKQQVFPTLNEGKFMNMTRNDMLSYALSDDRVSTARLFATFGSYMSYYLTPEGVKFLSDMSGYKGTFQGSNDAATYIEFLKLLFSSFTMSLFYRPLRGMAEVIDSLVASVRNYGGKLYVENPVLSVSKTNTKFVLKTTKLSILAEKLVIATPPDPFMKVKGSVAQEIQRQLIFHSIQMIPAFKGAAVYRDAWWQNKTAGQRTLETRQLYLSSSNCLGFTMPYGGRGANGEAVLHTMYMDGPCSKRWGNILKSSKSLVDREMKRALEYNFGMPVPDPLDTVYHYWDEGAWHVHKPGFNFTITEVSDWAKRPFPEQEIFIVGDAYSQYKGWTEGSIISANNALLEGWQAKEQSSSRKEKSKSVPLSELVLDPSRNIQIL